ncbi:hypothetical protein H0H92_013496 [Tricholoma furcatifolium]|nr:hypothetical protein H0H92_013496 [Tricholoma furcatifolium]
MDLRKAMRARMAQASSSPIHSDHGGSTPPATSPPQRQQPPPQHCRPQPSSPPSPREPSSTSPVQRRRAYRRRSRSEEPCNHANHRQPSTSPAGPPRTKRLHRCRSNSQDTPHE